MNKLLQALPALLLSSSSLAAGLAVGAAAPQFEAVSQKGAKISLAAFIGKPVVLYFYPRDDTPGCTVEAKGFRDENSAFERLGAVVLGVSTDDWLSHRDFSAKLSLPFLLLADPDGSIAKSYQVPTFLGMARRMTFLIDRRGNIARVFENVTPESHPGEVLEALRALP